ncbi:hypothetical protein AURDEDRAFT_113485, partial [Auricularia subglabra TFB-10046 SS5]
MFFAKPVAVKLLTTAVVALGCVYFGLGISRLYQIAGYNSYSLEIVNGALYQWVGLYPTVVTALLRMIVLSNPEPFSPANPPATRGPGNDTGQPRAYPLLPLRNAASRTRGQAPLREVTMLLRAKEKLQGTPQEAGEASRRESASTSNTMTRAGAEASRPTSEVPRGRWRAVHQAARGAGITPEALLASISLVQHPEQLR